MSDGPRVSSGGLFPAADILIAAEDLRGLDGEGVARPGDSAGVAAEGGAPGAVGGAAGEGLEQILIVAVGLHPRDDAQHEGIGRQGEPAPPVGRLAEGEFAPGSPKGPWQQPRNVASALKNPNVPGGGGGRENGSCHRLLAEIAG